MATPTEPTFVPPPATPTHTTPKWPTSRRKGLSIRADGSKLAYQAIINRNGVPEGRKMGTIREYGGTEKKEN